jgi:hypothetical protein
MFDGHEHGYPVNMRFDDNMRRSSQGKSHGSASPLIARRPGFRDRLLARLRYRQLDLALAGGVPPEQNPAVALRARRLIDPCNRRSMAEAFRRVLRESHDGCQLSYGHVHPCRRRVLAASEQLDELADALSRPGPVASHGVAEALLLLTDGTGPLYNPVSPASLSALAAGAIEDLQLQ